MAGHLLMIGDCEHLASTPNQTESRLERKTYFRTPPGCCGTAEQTFALGSPFGGTGVSKEGAQLVITFAFETIGVGRLDARAAAKNGRGDDRLRRLSAVPRRILGKSFPNSEYLDQIFSTILDDWWQAKVIWGGGKLH
jgi:RimJ/RimL family protein N-acetyltransferase